MLMYSEDAVPLPRNHRQRVAPREQLKQCIASSVAAEWYVADQIDSYIVRSGILPVSLLYYYKRQCDALCLPLLRAHLGRKVSAVAARRELESKTNTGELQK